MNDIKRPIPRAIKLTADSLEIIVNRNMQFDLPPNVDELLDAAVLPVEYYFVTDHPGVTPEKPISWVLVPDFMFHSKFRFADKESPTQLGAILEKNA